MAGDLTDVFSLARRFEYNASKVRSTFDSICEKYNREFPSDDVINLTNGCIVKNRGNLQRSASRKFGRSRFGQHEHSYSTCSSTSSPPHPDALVKTEPLDSSDFFSANCSRWVIEIGSESEPSDAETISSESSDEDDDVWVDEGRQDRQMTLGHSNTKADWETSSSDCDRSGDSGWLALSEHKYRQPHRRYKKSPHSTSSSRNHRHISSAERKPLKRDSFVYESTKCSKLDSARTVSVNRDFLKHADEFCRTESVAKDTTFYSSQKPGLHKVTPKRIAPTEVFRSDGRKHDQVRSPFSLAISPSKGPRIPENGTSLQRKLPHNIESLPQLSAAAQSRTDHVNAAPGLAQGQDPHEPPQFVRANEDLGPWPDTVDHNCVGRADKKRMNCGINHITAGTPNSQNRGKLISSQEKPYVDGKPGQTVASGNANLRQKNITLSSGSGTSPVPKDFDKTFIISQPGTKQTDFSKFGRVPLVSGDRLQANFQNTNTTDNSISKTKTPDQHQETAEHPAASVPDGSSGQKDSPFLNRSSVIKSVKTSEISSTPTHEENHDAKIPSLTEDSLQKSFVELQKKLASLMKNKPLSPSAKMIVQLESTQSSDPVQNAGRDAATNRFQEQAVLKCEPHTAFQSPSHKNMFSPPALTPQRFTQNPLDSPRPLIKIESPQHLSEVRRKFRPVFLPVSTVEVVKMLATENPESFTKFLTRSMCVSRDGSPRRTPTKKEPVSPRRAQCRGTDSAPLDMMHQTPPRNADKLGMTQSEMWQTPGRVSATSSHLVCLHPAMSVTKPALNSAVCDQYPTGKKSEANNIPVLLPASDAPSLVNSHMASPSVRMDMPAVSDITTLGPVSQGSLQVGKILQTSQKLKLQEIYKSGPSQHKKQALSLAYGSESCFSSLKMCSPIAHRVAGSPQMRQIASPMSSSHDDVSDSPSKQRSEGIIHIFSRLKQASNQKENQRQELLTRDIVVAANDQTSTGKPSDYNLGQNTQRTESGLASSDHAVGFCRNYCSQEGMSDRCQDLDVYCTEKSWSLRRQEQLVASKKSEGDAGPRGLMSDKNTAEVQSGKPVASKGTLSDKHVLTPHRLFNCPCGSDHSSFQSTTVRKLAIPTQHQQRQLQVSSITQESLSVTRAVPQHRKKQADQSSTPSKLMSHLNLSNTDGSLSLSPSCTALSQLHLDSREAVASEPYRFERPAVNGPHVRTFSRVLLPNGNFLGACEVRKGADSLVSSRKGDAEDCPNFQQTVTECQRGSVLMGSHRSSVTKSLNKQFAELREKCPRSVDINTEARKLDSYDTSESEHPQKPWVDNRNKMLYPTLLSGSATKDSNLPGPHKNECVLSKPLSNQATRFVKICSPRGNCGSPNISYTISRRERSHSDCSLSFSNKRSFEPESPELSTGAHSGYKRRRMNSIHGTSTPIKNCLPNHFTSFDDSLSTIAWSENSDANETVTACDSSESEEEEITLISE